MPEAIECPCVEESGITAAGGKPVSDTIAADSWGEQMEDEIRLPTKRRERQQAQNESAQMQLSQCRMAGCFN
jgi:hypothetical protein